MKKLELKTLGIETEVPENIWYHSDGSVPNVQRYQGELISRYFDKQPDLRLIWGLLNLIHRKPSGACMMVVPSLPEQIVHIHTFVQEGLLEPDYTLAFGHEETHALIYIGGLEKLQEALEKEKANIDLARLDQETVCSIGGIYAVLVKYPGARIGIRHHKRIIEFRKDHILEAARRFAEKRPDVIKLELD